MQRGLPIRFEEEHLLLLDDSERAKHSFGKVDVRFVHLTTLVAVPFHRALAFGALIGSPG